MATLRAVVGFMTFQIAFWFRHTGAPKWWFGVVLAFSALGNMGGTAVAPIIRRALHEERMIILSLGIATVGAGLAVLTPTRTAAALLALLVALAAALGRQAFDAVVQRDAPAANRGRSFARFETQFQIVWVAAALFPVVISFPGWLGFLILGLISLFGALTFVWGRRYVRLHSKAPAPMLGKLWRELETRRKLRERQIDPTALAQWEPPQPDERKGN
jgi:hypothetical protein